MSATLPAESSVTSIHSALRPGSPRWASPGWGALPPLWAFLLLGGGTCMCGHMDVLALALSAPAAAFAFLWALHGQPALRGLVALGPWALLVKGVCDVLWDGHDPVLTATPDFLLVPPVIALLGTVLLVFSAVAIAAQRRRAAGA